MSSRPSPFISRHDTAHAQELRRQRRVLLAMTAALALLLALTVTAPFWASLYICLRWGCL